MNEYLTFDDVLMRPNYCGFESRKDVSTKTVLVPGRLELDVPILSSPMDTITGPEMCVKMNELGGMGILHRFCSIEENVKMFNRAHEIQFQLNANHGVLNIGVSVGVNEGLDRATALWKAGARIFCVDTAHAHSKLAGRMVHSLRTEFGDEIIIIGGSVCCLVPETPILTRDLKWIPAGSLKVNDDIIGFDEFPTNGKRRNLSDAKITHASRRTIQCYKLTFSNGETFTCTGEHKWLGYSGKQRNRVWLQTDKLFEDFKAEKFSVTRIIRPWEELPDSYEKGYLAAAIDGEGSLRLPTKKVRGAEITFTQKDNAMLAKVKEYLTLFNFQYSEYAKLNSDCFVLRITGHGEVLRFLGQFRPARLLDKWMSWDLNTMSASASQADLDQVEIISIENVGLQEVSTISSSCSTYISYGYGSHNTYAGSDYLVSKGADIIRVGIGPGGFCLTRTQTGFGLPQFSTLQECAKCSKPIIADGGIKQPGDVVKALGIGSACVMLGSMLAGTLETPGEVIYENRNGIRIPEDIKQRPMPPLPIETNVATYYPFKAARGMASRSVVEEMYGEMPDWKTYEGISTMVPAKGSASEVIQNIIGGLRSGLTYAGAKDLEELRRRVDFVKITPAGRIESGAHILGK